MSKSLCVLTCFKFEQCFDDKLGQRQFFIDFGSIPLISMGFSCSYLYIFFSCEHCAINYLSGFSQK